MNNQMPDYRITLLTGILFGPRLEHRSFSVYIDSKVTKNDGEEDISGRINDCFGEGYITGNITNTRCNLTIKYGAEAIRNGAPEGILMYEGNLRKNAYIGGFKLMNISNEEEHNRNNIFAMKEYDPKKMLEDKPSHVAETKQNSSWN